MKTVCVASILNVAYKNIDQFVFAVMVSQEMAEMDVMRLVVALILNVHRVRRASIANALMFAKRRSVELMLFVAQNTIIVPHANAYPAIEETHKLNVSDPNARPTKSARIIWHAKMKSVEIHAIVAKEHCVALKTIDLHADVHQAIQAIQMFGARLYKGSLNVAWMAIAQANWPASVACARILATKRSHVLSMQVAALSILYH